MKRDYQKGSCLERNIFHRSTQMTHHYDLSPQEPRVFDPELPTLRHPNTNGFDNHTDGFPDYGHENRSNILKPSGEKARRSPMERMHDTFEAVFRPANKVK